LGEFANAVPRLEEAVQLFESEATRAAAAVRAVLQEAMTRSHAPEPEAEMEFDDVARRADDALAAVRALEDEGAREKSLELKSAWMRSRARLVALVRAVREDERGASSYATRWSAGSLRAVDDARHHPAEHRASRRRSDRQRSPGRAIARGDVELLRVEGNVAVVRLHGACVGCNAAAQTLKTESKSRCARACPRSCTSKRRAVR